MKGVILFFLFLATAFAQDDYDFDGGLTTSSFYQACKTATNVNQGITEGGTACIVYDTFGKNLHFTVAHSINPLDISALKVEVGSSITGVFASVFDSANSFASSWQSKGFLNLQATAADGKDFTDEGAYYLQKMPITGATQATITTASDTAVKITLTVVRGKNSAVVVNGISLVFTLNYGDMVVTTNKASRRTALSNTAQRKFSETNVETFYPTATRVLLSRYGNSKQQQQLWTSNQMTVVAVGPDTKAVKEGDIVFVKMSSCLSQLVHLNAENHVVDDVLAFSPYCWVFASDVYGVVSETSYGANRAAAGTGHIRQANPTGTKFTPNLYGASFY